MTDWNNIEIGSKKRNLQLDCLRGVAILMVILCHTILFRYPGWEAPLVQGGWAGVDLFFVLSGFLISGLLFAEFQRTRIIRFRRFAIRRALKIYPAFYALVLLTVVLRFATEKPIPVLQAFLHDLLFLQSYAPGTYGHFWSLSVEEHFYILFPLALYLMLRRNGSATDPFRFLPWLFGLVAVTTLLARLFTARYVPFSWQTHLFPTHLRIDSLLFGVLLSYWAHFHGSRFWGFVQPRYPLFLLVGAFMISPIFIISQYDPWMYTYGFTVLYLGFGALLLAVLSIRVELLPQVVQALPRALARIGGFSYSIYLWHIPWLIILFKWGIIRIPYVGLITYIVGSVALGITASQIVEIPAVRIRDRLFPAFGARSLSRISAIAQQHVEPNSYQVTPVHGSD
jgi:peptidoglycan/LPS O-acetylase OafA/YrhL